MIVSSSSVSGMEIAPTVDFDSHDKISLFINFKVVMTLAIEL